MCIVYLLHLLFYVMHSTNVMLSYVHVHVCNHLRVYCACVLRYDEIITD